MKKYIDEVQEDLIEILKERENENESCILRRR